MNIYDMLVNRALNGGGGGGGGGSSDLSTCTMTITGLNEGAYADIQFPVIEDEPPYFAGAGCLTEADNGDYLLPLYKGVVVVFLGVNIEEENYTVSGNAIYMEEDRLIQATGDFTIAFHF